LISEAFCLRIGIARGDLGKFLTLVRIASWLMEKFYHHGLLFVGKRV
jgi:hypothetical protein